mgnify:CR=1 FL=1
MAKVQIKSENLTPLGGFFDDGTIKTPIRDKIAISCM